MKVYYDTSYVPGMLTVEGYSYDELPTGEPYEWMGLPRFDPYDTIDFHLDLGCGTIKKGRIGIDRWPADGVDIVMDLGEPRVRLPFLDSTIESVISHHFFEHLDNSQFIHMVDEVHRVLVPGGIARIITPAYPSRTAVDDPDHKMFVMAGTWRTFEGFPDNHWHSSFSVPYMKARFEILDLQETPLLPPEQRWGVDDAREIRVALKARK